MINFTRGEIVLANLEPTIGHEQQGDIRPCLIVSSNYINDVVPIVVICPITKAKPGRIRRYGAVTIPAKEGGLDFDSDILTIQIRAIDLSRIKDTLGKVSLAQMDRIDLSLKMVLDLD